MVPIMDLSSIVGLIKVNSERKEKEGTPECVHAVLHKVNSGLHVSTI